MLCLQWGATLTWSAELPLPLPLQFDEVANGCRLGFVTVRDGAVCLVTLLLEHSVCRFVMTADTSHKQINPCTRAAHAAHM